MRRNTLAAARKSELFLSRCLYVDVVNVDSERIGDPLAHKRNVRRELRSLRDNCGIHVNYKIILFPQKRSNVARQSKAVGALVSGIGVGKMLSNISKRRRTEKCIHYRVQKHVRIRMS